MFSAAFVHTEAKHESNPSAHDEQMDKPIVVCICKIQATQDGCSLALCTTPTQPIPGTPTLLLV